MEWLFLLLPVAAASGWLIGRTERHQAPQTGREPTFFRGLNYLLNEQPDKAVDVFLKLAEVDDETVETHLALGALFRRRGEVDRAIRIHQNLVAREALNDTHRGFALYELGRDYMLAGLLDRAESLFTELVERQLQQQARPARPDRDLPGREGLAEVHGDGEGAAATLGSADVHRDRAVPLRAGRAVPAGRRHGTGALAPARRPDGGHGLRPRRLLQARMEMAAGDPGSAALLYRRIAQRTPATCR
jgi:tetratricopeptide (TPR) repeat protein